MVQPKKCWLRKPRDLSSDSSTRVKARHGGVSVILELGRLRQDGFWSSLARYYFQISEFQTQYEVLSQKLKFQGIKEDN